MIDKSNTLNLLLSYAANVGVTKAEHARRIRKCAKYISQDTKDKALKNACRALRNQKNNELVITGVSRAMNVMLDGDKNISS